MKYKVQLPGIGYTKCVNAIDSFLRKFPRTLELRDVPRQALATIIWNVKAPGSIDGTVTFDDATIDKARDILVNNLNSI